MTEPKSLNVLVVGGGGREHALVEACLASPLRKNVIAAPGNAGIAEVVPCFPVAADDIQGIVDLAAAEAADLVVVGPEVPLSLGLADALREKNILVYGPGRAGARLEASKIFTKDLLRKHDIPTAVSATFTESEPALAYLRDQNAYPVVIKADGLAAGKGVLIAQDAREAEDAVRSCLERNDFGESGRSILIEEFLFGDEASLHLMVSGRDFVVLPTSQDHKRAGENDTGPNTGGMGAYSPAELIDTILLEKIRQEIARPAVEAIASEGLDFRGTLFIGLMLTAGGPRVLEFNVRFGDPETQVILPRMQTDPLRLMRDCAAGKLADTEIEEKAEAALCVVLAAGGYPGAYRKGAPITLPDGPPQNCHLFHAGTALDSDGRLVTAGGRVLGVTALSGTLAEAAHDAYTLCQEIRFDDMHYRRDIGKRQLSGRN